MKENRMNYDDFLDEDEEMFECKDCGQRYYSSYDAYYCCEYEFEEDFEDYGEL
jgi:hypothetical protein